MTCERYRSTSRSDGGTGGGLNVVIAAGSDRGAVSVVARGVGGGGLTSERAGAGGSGSGGTGGMNRAGVVDAVDGVGGGGVGDGSGGAGGGDATRALAAGAVVIGALALPI
jgi:hypothetical protein